MSTTTTSTQRLKIIPGRGLTGRDIKKRLRNRTLEGQTFGEEAYTLNEDMVAFTKMSKVEQIEHVRNNNKKIQVLQSKMEGETNEKRRKQQEQHIEQEINKRMAAMRKEEPKT